MASLGLRFRARALPPGQVVIDTGGARVTAGELADLAACTPPGCGPQDIVTLAPAHVGDLARLVALLDGKVAALRFLPADLAAQATDALTAPPAVVHPHQGTAVATRWDLATSGSTGAPKFFAHAFASLARGVPAPPYPAPSDPAQGQGAPVWGMLYDPCRFAGLQVLLHALLGGSRLVAPAADLPFAQRIASLAAGGVTHLSATPSLWRRVLMAPAARDLALRQVTLGGETADQPLLDRLARQFPAARISHHYASTEAGTGFSVHDGIAGFPQEWLDRAPHALALRIRDDMLWIRPDPQTLRAGREALFDADGFLCTQDRVELAQGRVRFLGRAGNVINVGGAKVHPERVEAVLKQHPAVLDCQVVPRPSAMLGALIAARVVLDPGDAAHGAPPADTIAALKRWCREHLPREARPATIEIAPELALTRAGKVARVPA